MESLFQKKRYTINRIRTKSRYLQAAVLIAASFLYFGARHLTLPHSAAAKDDLCYISRVVDGDTLKLSDGRRVRLIGVDTPEVYPSEKLSRDARRTHTDIATIQAMGRKASDFTKELCSNKKVRLEFDVERYDRYGRTLAYVYLEDGTFVNARIVEEGYGQIMTIPPNVKYAEYFEKLEKEARKAKRGLWA